MTRNKVRRKLYTHMGDWDLDAVTSCAAVLEFVPGMSGAEIVRVSAAWNGEGMEKDAMAVDLPAGGKGIKGARDTEGKIHSALAKIVRIYRSAKDALAIKNLVDFVDCQDAYGSPVKRLLPGADSGTRGILSGSSIGAVLKAFQYANPDDSQTVFLRMREVFQGLLLLGQDRGAVQGLINRGAWSEFFPRRQSLKDYIEYHLSEYPSDALAIRNLTNFCQIHDEYGSVVDHLIPGAPANIKEMFALNSVGAILLALEYLYPNADRVVFDRMTEIFRGFLLMGQTKPLVEMEARRAEFFPAGESRRKIALVRDRRHKNIDHFLIGIGVEVIIYVEGMNMGVRVADDVRLPDGSILRADHPAFRRVVYDIGETIGPEPGEVHSSKKYDHFPHSAGFVMAHGTDAAPATRPSKVNPSDWVKAAEKLLYPRR